MLDMAKRKTKTERLPKQLPKTNPHLSPKLQFHLPADLRTALEAYCEATKPQPTMTAALRLALEEFLSRAGFWPPKEGDA